MPEVLQGKTAGQGLSSTGPEAPERHSDTEEVTGSNPVRPTPFFEILSGAVSQDGSQAPEVLSNKRWSRRWHSDLSTRRPGGSGQLGALSRGRRRVQQPSRQPDVLHGQYSMHTYAGRYALPITRLSDRSPCLPGVLMA